MSAAARSSPLGDGRSESPTPEASVPVELTRLSFEKLIGGGITTLTHALNETSKIAEKGVTVFLLSVGGVLGFLCLFLKVEIGGHRFGTLSPAEFATGFIVSGFLILAGAALRLWSYQCQYSIQRQILTAQLKIYEATAGIAEKGLAAASEIGKANAAIAQKQLETGAATTQKALEGVGGPPNLQLPSLP